MIKVSFSRNAVNYAPNTNYSDFNGEIKSGDPYLFDKFLRQASAAPPAIGKCSRMNYLEFGFHYPSKINVVIFSKILQHQVLEPRGFNAGLP